jgi:hypothetical protein
MLLTATSKKEKKTFAFYLKYFLPKKQPIVNISLQENEDILKYLKSIFFVANSEKSKI